jgi:hypothetical protein
VSALRRLVFWVLLFAMPVQALATPGWLCAKPAHGAAQVYQRVDASAESRGADASVISEEAGTEHGSPQLPGAGKCAACTGCCFSAAALPAITRSPAPVEMAHAAADYGLPAVAARDGGGLFRPPRTLSR